MKESLTCTSCGSTWKRDKTRGRKPHLCPKCVKAEVIATVKPANKETKKLTVKRGRKAKPIVETEIKPEVKINTEIKNKTTSDLTVSKIMQSFHPKSSNHEELRESTKNGSTWKCTNCGNILKLEISITDIPTHRCTPNMVSVKPYERIK
jgi:predicted RNA-binding Zn-ribbon protein involved in translation (DUF1610 family)